MELMMTANTDPQDNPSLTTEQTVSAQAASAFNQANADFKAKRWSQACAGYVLALQENPHFEAAALQRARCLVMMNDQHAAREGFRRSSRRFRATTVAGWKPGICVDSKVFRIRPCCATNAR